MNLPPGSVAGPLEQDQRWGGRILVKGDVIVPAGITLTLAPGTVLRFSPVPIHHVEERRTRRGETSPVHDRNKCCVMVFGRLIVEGSPQAPVELGAGSEWGGLHFLGEGSGIVKHAVFADAVSEAVALWDRSGVDLESAVMRRCWEGVGVYGRASARLKGCRMTDMRDGGLSCEGGSVDWDGGGWQGGKTGVRLSGGSARLRNLEGGGSDRGLVLESGSLRGDGLNLKDHRDAALSMGEAGSAVLADSRFEGGSAGAVTKGARLELTGCEFAGFDAIGVELSGRGHRLERAAIRGSKLGLVIGQGSAEARELRTECSGTGVVLRAGGELDWTGGGAAGGEIGVLLAGGNLRLGDAAITGAGQGVRLESGRLDGSGLILKGHRDAALSMLAVGSASVSASRFEDGPVGAKTRGARLELSGCEFSGLARIGVDLTGGGHRLSRTAIRGSALGLVVEEGSAEVRELTTDRCGTGVDVRRGAELDWKGGGTAGGEIGVRVAGGALRMRDAVCAGSTQGLRLESGTLRGDGLILKNHRDAALSLLAEGSAAISGSRIEDSPVGAVTSGAALSLRGTQFLRCSSVCLSLEAGVHSIDGCFFDPTCRDLLVGPGAEARRDDRTRRFDAAWRLVLRTRNWPVLRGLYRAIYSAAVFRVGRWARGDARVRSALVGRGWVTGDWEPGVSDLDFTVVAEPLGGAGGAAWLEGFWRSYAGWRRWCPFLGEILVASPDDLACFLRWGGIRAREIQAQTIPLKGPGLAGTPAPPDAHARVQALQESAHAYTRFMQWGYFPGRTPPEAAARQLRKAVVDLLRYGRAAEEGALSPVATRTEFSRNLEAADRDPRMSPELHARMLRRFHAAARSVLSSEAADAAPSAYRWIPSAPAASPPADVVKSRDERGAGLRSCFSDSLRGVCWDDLYRSYIVLEDAAVEDPRLSGALGRWAGLRAGSSQPGPLPVVVSRSLFTAWRRLPYLECPTSFLDFPGTAEWSNAGSAFPNCRQFRWGAAEPSAPPPDAFVRRLALESAANLRLTWRLLGSPANRLTSVYVLHYLFSRTIGLRLLLEKGVGASFFDLDALLALHREHFPEDRKALEPPPAEEWLRSPQQAFFARYGFLDERISLLGKE